MKVCHFTFVLCSDEMTHTHLVDHVQSALKDGVKDLGDFSRDVDSQLVDNGCHGAEDLGLTGSGDIALVVDEDGVQQRWNKVLPYLEEQRGVNIQIERKTGLRQGSGLT